MPRPPELFLSPPAGVATGARVDVPAAAAGRDETGARVSALGSGGASAGAGSKLMSLLSRSSVRSPEFCRLRRFGSPFFWLSAKGDDSSVSSLIFGALVWLGASSLATRGATFGKCGVGGGWGSRLP